MAELGVVIACTPRDAPFARGCCASVRRFLGEVPICLLADGDVGAEDLVAAYGVSVLQRRHVSCGMLRERSFGWGLTKMVAFWQSPWERFLLLDADTVVWGDVRRYADFDRYDVVVDRHLYQVAADDGGNPYLADLLRDRPSAGGRDRGMSLLRQWFFDPGQLAQRVPGFDWRRHLYDYFCSGALFARRGILSLDSYAEALDWAERHPGLFGPGEMGLLNFLVFHAADQGRLRVGQHERLQTLACRHSRQELGARFPLGALRGEGAVIEPSVLHWSGRPKPTLGRADVYSEPMTWFRAQCLRDVHGHRVRAVGARLRWQELRAAWSGARHAARRRGGG